MTGVSVAWASGNETVGTINETGLFTALAEGTVTITATAENKSAEATVTVTAEDAGHDKHHGHTAHGHRHGQRHPGVHRNRP